MWSGCVALASLARCHGAFDDGAELARHLLREGRSRSHDVTNPLLTGLVEVRERFAWGAHTVIVRVGGWPVKRVRTTHDACHA